LSEGVQEAEVDGGGGQGRETLEVLEGALL